jgi:hypothetical protein
MKNERLKSATVTTLWEPLERIVSYPYIGLYGILVLTSPHKFVRHVSEVWHWDRW